MREIAGYNGKYLVSENGEIYSFRRQGCEGKIISQRPNSSGYMRVDLLNEGKRRSVFVHRIVAETFIPNPENKECINHIDGNKKNNSVNNLEWCTYSENMKHAVLHGLNRFPGLSGENHPNSKLSYKDVEEIKKQKNIISGRKLAKKYNVSNVTIYNIWNGKVWK